MITVNLNKALENEYYARAVFYDYNYNPDNRKYAVSDTDMMDITSYWEKKGKVALWREYASKDKTEYIIDGDDYEDAKETGKKSAKEGTGYDGGKDRGAVGDLIMSAGTAAAAAPGIISSAAKATTKAAAKAAAKETGKAVAKETGKAATKAGKIAKVSDIVTVVMAAAVATKYWIEKPNQEQSKAAQKLAESELPQGENALYNAQADMLRSEEEIATLVEEAEATNDEANSEIQDNKTEYDLYAKTFEGLQARRLRGENLSESENDLYKTLATKLAPEGDLVQDNKNVQDDASKIVGGIEDDIDGYQSNYDTSAATIAEVEGVTDFAAGFDESTKKMIKVESAAQGINAISAGIAAARLAGKGPVGWAFAAVGAAAVAGSGLAFKQQHMDYKPIVDSEIAFRKNTQELEGTTTDFYNDSLDLMVANSEEVKGMTIDMPRDMDGVTADTTVQPQNQPFGAANKNDDDDEDKKNQSPLL